VHARIGSLAMAGKDYRAANASLDTAYRIATARLHDEWATSAERVGLLLRELKPALRLLAQTRIVVGAAGGADARPDNAFEELQLAMLGETAAGLQAAERRRLTAEPALAAALKARDAAGARLDFLKAFDEAVGTLDEATRDADRAKATQSLATAKQAVDALLPMSESLASLKPLSLAQARSLMRPDEALLLLHAGSDAVYGSLVTQKGEPLFWRSPIALAELDRRVAALRKGLDVQGRIPDFPLADAHALYRLLLGPAAARLDEARSLMVVGDGPLLSFPLAVLPRELPARMPERPDDYRDAGVKWLGLSHAIAYLPTLRALEPRRSGRLASRAKFQFAGVGNPILADGAGAARAINFAEAFRKDSLADVEVLRRAASLPETETELRAVSRLVGGRDDDLFLQARASEPLVRKNGLADYRIIMFATHGLMGGELAGMAEPGLVLTPPAEASAEDDGLLTASEIMALRLDADLVILSACNTAAADGRPRAEGFSGLPRAFLSAGARNVVVTHWAIPSQPAVVVTSRMMEERARDPDLTWSEALRRSFAHVIGEAGPASFAHPSNWAAFSLVGPATGTAR
jgi:CHAT domain-containing protein